MADPNRAILERTIELLEPLLDQLVFVGGCATGLLVTDSAAGGIRPTKDVDAIVMVASYAEYAAVSDEMRVIGFVEDNRDLAPICRFRRDDLIVDLMPTDASILGFTNRWYVAAVTSAQTISIAGHHVKLVDPVHFLATKLDAFHGRGQGHFATSHDLEDILMIVDGRPELLAEIERRRRRSEVCRQRDQSTTRQSGFCRRPCRLPSSGYRQSGPSSIIRGSPTCNYSVQVARLPAQWPNAWRGECGGDSPRPWRA